jgi:hypothetical protein
MDRDRLAGLTRAALGAGLAARRRLPAPGPMRQIAEHHTRKLLEMRL